MGISKGFGSFFSIFERLEAFSGISEYFDSFFAMAKRFGPFLGLFTNAESFWAFLLSSLNRFSTFPSSFDVSFKIGHFRSKFDISSSRRLARTSQEPL